MLNKIFPAYPEDSKYFPSWKIKENDLVKSKFLLLICIDGYYDEF